MVDEEPTTTFCVYLSESSSDPDSGTEHEDYMSITCSSITPTFVCENDKQDMPAHKSFEVKTGQMKFSAILNNCVITKLHTSAVGSTCWNDFIDFVAEHAKQGGKSLYLWVKLKFGDDSGEDRYWMRWIDDSYDRKKYMKCRIKTFRFTITAADQMGKGMIQVEEAWLN